jgi:hypothetical protein
VKAQSMKLVGVAVALMASLSSGCGEVARNGRAPVLAIIQSLEAASGAEPEEFGGTLSSDVVTLVDRPDEDGGPYLSVYPDIGQVSIRLTLRDPGIPGIGATPSTLNEVTFFRYRVAFRRADGRNTPGVDVPFPFDSALTFTVPAEGTATASFELIRHNAKQESPLAALANQATIISTIADITFYGRDQAGNDISVTGSIGIFFGNFADPD